MKPVYKRILLKLSGEALSKQGQRGVDPDVVHNLCGEIKTVHDLGVQLAIVVGGGNIFRGTENPWMERTTADYSGMLATVINSLTLQSGLEEKGIMTRVLSAIEMQQIAEPYIRRRAIRHMEKQRVVIFAAGTGNPYFSTDTAASLRAIEMSAEVVFKGTKVDGVYTADPKVHDGAERYEKLEHLEVLQKRLKVMDSTAISLCMDNHLPIVVFDVFKAGNFRKVVCGENIGTRVQ